MREWEYHYPGMYIRRLGGGADHAGSFDRLVVRGNATRWVAAYIRKRWPVPARTIWTSCPYGSATKAKKAAEEIVPPFGVDMGAEDDDVATR